jgi:hypothetical protein
MVYTRTLLYYIRYLYALVYLFICILSKPIHTREWLMQLRRKYNRVSSLLVHAAKEQVLTLTRLRRPHYWRGRYWYNYICFNNSPHSLCSRAIIERYTTFKLLCTCGNQFQSLTQITLTNYKLKPYGFYSE